MYAKIILANCFCAALFSLFLWLCPSAARGEIYQWTDSRGVIHFTDSLQSVPEAMRGSPNLIIRTDIKNHSYEIPVSPLNPTEEPLPESEAPESTASPEPEEDKAVPPVVHIDSQNFTIVVINSNVHHSRKKKGCLIRGGCKPIFRPSFKDRRYIHPSVFNGGSNQYIYPKLFPPAHRQKHLVKETGHRLLHRTP